LVAGTSILGDATYEPEESKGTYPRMCLHAQSLSLPVLGGKQLNVEASDPFDLDEIIKGIAGS
jgi:23S rRNA-/tRNA-specific pseudouridylate synthase